MYRMRPLSFIGIALLALGVIHGCNYLLGPAPSSSISDSESGDGSVVWSHGHDGNAENAEEHWTEHGREFPEFHSAEEYEHAALQFVQNPPQGTLTRHRDNGDTLFYNPATNTFAVSDSEGEPRTMFKPSSGEIYWDHQH